MKKNFKRIVAGVLAIALAITGLTVDRNRGSEVEAADTVTDVQPITLEGFKHVTVCDFIDDSQVTMKDGTYGDVGNGSEYIYKLNTNTFDKTLISAKVSLVPGSANFRNRFHIAGANNTGLRFWATDANTMTLRDMDGLTGQGVNVNLASFSAITAGVKSFYNEEFLLQISFEFGDFDSDTNADDVKMGFYFNGNLYANQHIVIIDGYSADNQSKWGSKLAIYVENEGGYTPTVTLESVDVAPDFVPEVLEGFTQVTGCDFVNTSGEILEDNKYTHGGHQYQLNTNSYDKTVVSAKLTIVQGDRTYHSRLNIASTTNAGEGLRLQLLNSQSMQLVDKQQLIGGSTISFDAATAGLTTFSDKEFLLQISFAFGDFDQQGNEDDVQIGFYFNGKLYNDAVSTFYNIDKTKWGNWFSLYLEDANGKTPSITWKSVDLATTPNLSDFTHKTLKDFGDLEDGYQTSGRYALSDVGSLNNCFVSFKTKYLAGGKNNALGVGAGATGSGSDGFQVYVNETGTELYLYDNYAGKAWGMVEESSFQRVYKASTAGVSSFLNEEFLLQMSFEIGDFDSDSTQDDLQIGMYFNGKLYQNRVTTIYNVHINQFSKAIKISGESTIHLASVEADTPVYLEGFNHVTISDFGNSSGISSLTDKTYVNGDGAGFWLTSGVGTLNNTMVSMKVTFGEGKNLSDGSFHNATTGFHIAGIENGGGFLVFVSGDGKTLCLQESVERTKDTVSGEYHKRISYSAETAGVESFLNNDFLLQMSFEYTDAGTGYPGGNTGLTDLANTKLYDVKIGMYFNGKLYNNEKTEINKCRQDKLGAHFDLRLNADTSSLALASADAETHHNLLTGAYSHVDGTQILVNGEQYAGVWLDKPGDYDLKVGTAQTTKKVITYLEGDVNIDGVADVRDIIAGKKALKTTPETKAAKLGMDMDRDDKLTATDVGKMRTFLVTGANESISYIGEGVMPIAGFWGPTNQHVNNEMFQKIADMGLNLISYTALDYKSSPELVKKYLTLADKHKIGVFVTDSNVTDKANGTAIKKSEIAQALAAYRNYPAFCGMYLVDEPHTDYYGQNGSGVLVSQLGSLAKVLQKDFDLTCYANLFGMGSANAVGENAYERYVKEFCETVRPKVLMWDYYVYSGNSTVSQYFENMSIIRKYAEQYNIPFWSFIQAGNDWNTDKSSTEGYSYSPNQSEFEWNVNTSLAFGAKGIQYFPLIQPGSFYADCKDYRQNGLIGADGNTNQWYDYAKKMNTQIAAVDEVLMNSINKGIILSGSASAVSAETSEYLISSGSFQALQSVTGDCLVGCFNYQGKTALYVVNYSTEAKTDVTLTLNKTYTVKTVQNATSSSEQANNITLNMAAGEGVLVVVQ